MGTRSTVIYSPGFDRGALASPQPLTMPGVGIQASSHGVSPLVLDACGGSPMLVDDPGKNNRLDDRELEHCTRPAASLAPTGDDRSEESNKVEYHPLVNGTISYTILLENHHDQLCR